MTMKKMLLAWIILLAVTGCATKRYVDKQVNEALASGIGLVRTQMEGSISDLQKSVAEVKEEVGTTKSDVKELKEAVAEQKNLINDAIARAQESGNAKGKLLYEAVISEEAVSFGFHQSKLSDDAKGAIDNFAEMLLKENKNVYLEIQGHTDNIGSEKYNLKLGQDRAEAVRRYLHEKYDIPLHRMNTFSYGESKPLAPNDRESNRAKNRRVAIMVME
jgi:outer membrane protein OmpA-like peptidoglycan-associated protein